MKKTTLLCTLATIVAFGAGFCMSQIMHSKDTELIATQNAAIQAAEQVMWNNGLWDTDGSDDMALYVELYCEVDSLWNTQL